MNYYTDPILLDVAGATKALPGSQTTRLERRKVAMWLPNDGNANGVCGRHRKFRKISTDEAPGRDVKQEGNAMQYAPVCAVAVLAVCCFAGVAFAAGPSVATTSGAGGLPPLPGRPGR
jgi:hypothetical protein